MKRKSNTQKYVDSLGIKKPVRIDPDEIIEAIESDENAGFCILCGEKAYGVEPDARNYTCEYCGSPKVFGAEELMIMGYAN